MITMFGIVDGLVTLTLRNDGTEDETELTVPVPGESVTHEVCPAPLVCRNWPAKPSDVGGEII